MIPVSLVRVASAKLLLLLLASKESFSRGLLLDPAILLVISWQLVAIQFATLRVELLFRPLLMVFTKHDTMAQIHQLGA